MAGLLTTLLRYLERHPVSASGGDFSEDWFRRRFALRRLLFVSLVIIYLTEKARRAETNAGASREQLLTTLRSSGDAVIATDSQGRVTFMNEVAQDLTGWKLNEAEGKELPEVFRIVKEETREVVESPAAKVIREGVTVGLANHTILIAKDEREIPIDDSGAPIRDGEGKIVGVVLVFVISRNDARLMKCVANSPPLSSPPKTPSSAKRSTASSRVGMRAQRGSTVIPPQRLSVVRSPCWFRLTARTKCRQFLRG